jgi:hypothetical protein
LLRYHLFETSSDEDNGATVEENAINSYSDEPQAASGSNIDQLRFPNGVIKNVIVSRS